MSGCAAWNRGKHWSSQEGYQQHAGYEFSEILHRALIILLMNLVICDLDHLDSVLVRMPTTDSSLPAPYAEVGLLMPLEKHVACQAASRGGQSQHGYDY